MYLSAIMTGQLEVGSSIFMAYFCAPVRVCVVLWWKHCACTTETGGPEVAVQPVCVKRAGFVKVAASAGCFIMSVILLIVNGMLLRMFDKTALL